MKLKLAGVTGLLVLASLVLASGAEADHRKRWRFHLPKIYAPHFPAYVFDEDEAYDEAYYDEEDDIIIVEPRRNRLKQRKAYVEDELVPVYYDPNLDEFVPLKTQKPKKTVTKKKTTTAIVKPKAKPVAVAKAAATVKPQSVVAQKTPKPVVPAATLQTASLGKPAPKSIGCTAGAAVVTGYGFGAVKPKACTGATYTYDAARAGKSYLISLSAASGEITDVKKLQ